MPAFILCKLFLVVRAVERGPQLSFAIADVLRKRSRWGKKEGQM